MMLPSLPPLVGVVVVLSLVARAGRGVRLPVVAKKGQPTNHLLKFKMEKPRSSYCAKYKGQPYYSTVTLTAGDTVLLPCLYCGMYAAREKTWFTAGFVWWYPWDMQLRLQQLGVEREVLVFTSPLDLLGRLKKRNRKFLMSREEEKDEARRLRRLKAAAPWPTSRGFRRRYDKDSPTDAAKERLKQQRLLELIWRYSLYHGAASPGLNYKFLSDLKYKENMGHALYTKKLESKVHSLKMFPWRHMLRRDSARELLRGEMNKLWLLWLYTSHKKYTFQKKYPLHTLERAYRLYKAGLFRQPRLKITPWSKTVVTAWQSVHMFGKRSFMTKLNKGMAMIPKHYYRPTLFSDLDTAAKSTGNRRLSDDARELEHEGERQMKLLNKHKAKALLQQRILHKNFHRVINTTLSTLVEKFLEEVKNYKEGKRPQKPEGILQQSLRFPWNEENKKMARKISLELLLFSISAGDIGRAREVADNIASSGHLQKMARQLGVYGLVRAITGRTLDTEEVQQAAARLYDGIKMVELVADNLDYEMVTQHLLGVFDVPAREYTVMSRLSHLRPRDKHLQLSDESLILYRAIANDTGLYTCTSGFLEDFTPNCFTYYLEVLEERGHFFQQEGNQQDYETYKKQVKQEFNKVLKNYWNHDDGFLRDTEFFLLEGSESECSACNSKTGIKKQDIELRIFNTRAKVKFGFIQRARDMMSFARIMKTTDYRRTRSRERRVGIHVRSPDIRRLAPAFHTFAQDKITEFMLVTPCLGTRVCKADVETLTPEDFFDRQPLAYVHEAKVGHPVKMTCPTRHPDRVVWYFNGRPLFPAGQVFVNKAQVGIAKVGTNHTGNYSCIIAVKKGDGTTFQPQGFVYLKLNTRTIEIQLYTVLYDLGVLFLLLLVVQVPLACITPLHKWYQVEARRYTFMMSTLYRLKAAIDAMGWTEDFEETRKLQRLRKIKKAIESRKVCHMVQVQEQLAQLTEVDRDDEEWLALLSSEIWRLQNTTHSQADV